MIAMSHIVAQQLPKHVYWLLIKAGNQRNQIFPGKTKENVTVLHTVLI